MKADRGQAMPRTPDVVDAFVGSRIAFRRAALGLSQTALADRLGVSFQQVQKYETGANRVSASRLHHIAEVLGASVASFFPDRTADERPDDGDADWMTSLRFLSASAEERRVATGFPLIQDRGVRQALACIVGALSTR